MVAATNYNTLIAQSLSQLSSTPTKVHQPVLSPAIIVGFDGTHGPRVALHAAIDLADTTNQPLFVVYVEEVPAGVTAGTLVSPGTSALITADPSHVDACRRECTVILNDDVPWAVEVRRGNPAHELAAAASQHAATFIEVSMTNVARRLKGGPGGLTPKSLPISRSGSESSG